MPVSMVFALQSDKKRNTFTLEKENKQKNSKEKNIELACQNQ
jgi:hypothetical protein